MLDDEKIVDLSENMLEIMPIFESLRSLATLSTTSERNRDSTLEKAESSSRLAASKSAFESNVHTISFTSSSTCSFPIRLILV